MVVIDDLEHLVLGAKAHVDVSSDEEWHLPRPGQASQGSHLAHPHRTQPLGGPATAPSCLNPNYTLTKPQTAPSCLNPKPYRAARSEPAPRGRAARSPSAPPCGTRLPRVAATRARRICDEFAVGRVNISQDRFVNLQPLDLCNTYFRFRVEGLGGRQGVGFRGSGLWVRVQGLGLGVRG